MHFGHRLKIVQTTNDGQALPLPRTGSSCAVEVEKTNLGKDDKKAFYIQFICIILLTYLCVFTAYCVFYGVSVPLLVYIKSENNKKSKSKHLLALWPLSINLVTKPHA